MKYLTKKLYLLAMLVAAFSFAPNAFAQEKKDSAGSWYEDSSEEKPVSRKVLRKQMLADQRTLDIMRQNSTGEYASRPSVRFPNYMSYQPQLARTYYATPFWWNRSISYGWY